MFEVGKDIYRFGGRVAKHRDLERSRLKVVHFFISGVFLLFFAKTLYYGVMGTDNVGKADVGGNWSIARADIEDRNGVKLAKNVVSTKIQLVSKRVQDPDAVASAVHEIFPYKYSVGQVLDWIKKGKYVVLKEHATDGEVAVLKKVMSAAKQEARRQKKSVHNLVGLETVSEQVRRYPKHNLFAHMVGFVGKEGEGLEGAEKTFDSYLRENTDSLKLSLDARIQEQFHNRLTEAVQKYRAKGAMGMLMNSRTGELLAMVSLPDYDPENVSAYPVENRRFKPTRDVLEMGSVFKIFNTALAYENGIGGKYYVAKPYVLRTKSGRYVTTFHDVSKFDEQWMDVDDVMVHSCNVGSVQIAEKFPDGAQPEFFHRLHLDEKLDLDFGKTETPMLPKKWGITEVATVSFGHGVAVTPMHLLLGVNAVTNGGIYIKPTIKKRDVGRIQGTRVLSEDISAKLRQNMVRVVEETSGKLTRINGIKIGGKTGTAEKRVNGVIDKKRNMTTFVGVFPADAPQYIIMITLDEPQGLVETGGWRTASQNSVPTAGKILDGILPLLFE
jgi:cell division protein FtsI (penicillin-binding protein 3)